MTTRQSFFEGVSLTKSWNKVIEWNGYRIGTVRWQQDREWKLLENDEDFDTIKDYAYRPAHEFHTQQELWDYIKADLKAKQKT